jgi:AraC-like DNA-binding protein
MSAFFEIGGQEWRLSLAANCGRVRFPPSRQTDMEWWQRLRDFDLWFVWAGEGSVEFEEGRKSLSAGSCIWKRPGRRYIIRHSDQNPLGVNFFHFDLLGKRGVDGPEFPEPPFEFTRVQQFVFADQVMQRILNLRSEAGGEKSATFLFTALLTELIREAEQRPIANSKVRTEHVERIRQVLADIRAEPGARWNVAELSRESGYSLSHFSRLFAEVAGKRPQEFLIDTRLEKARELLSLSQCTISSAADQSGFRDVYYFSRLFKQRTGQTPSAYRRQLSQW